jgi:hypothetical protein
MSTILRALRRLEEEKTADELLELHDSVVAPSFEPPPRKRRGMLLGIAGAGVVAALLGAVVTWQILGGTGSLPAGDVAAAAPARGQERDIPVESRPARTAEAQMPETTILIETRQHSERLAPVAAPPPAYELPEISSEVLVHRRAPAPKPMPVVAAPEPVRPVPQAVPRVQPRTEAFEGAVPVRRAPVRREVSPPAPPVRLASPQIEAPVEVAVLRAEPQRDFPVVAPPGFEPDPAPAPQSRPPAASKIPSVTVTKTVWHPSADRRSAIIQVDGNTRDLKEGDTVGDLVLTKIKPSGVVFDYEGVELVRKVGADR